MDAHCALRKIAAGAAALRRGESGRAGFFSCYFIGNSDLLKRKEKHMFSEHTFDRLCVRYTKQTVKDLEDIKAFLSKIAIKWVILI